MGLLSFFSRKPSNAAAPGAEAVEQARTRARRRLIGAAVLVGIGVIAFPLLFETQPRPIAVDVPIEIPRKEAVAPLPSPTPRAPEVPPQPPEVAAETKVAPAEPVPAGAPPPVATKRTPAPAATPDKPAAAANKRRTVVQIGAYADAGAAREARQRVEKLGLKTFTQVVQTDAGKRIRVRVGPFTTRDEADRAVGRIKSAGLPAAVVAP